MIEHILKSALTLGLLMLISAPIWAQARNSQQCLGPIYEGKQVARRAKIIHGPDLNSINSFANGQKAHVVIRGVLCRSGHVTDLQLIEGTPSNLTDHIKFAVSIISFTPAELNWHTVSQRMAFEFDINGGETKMISEEEAKGRLVERLEIIGNRRLTAQQIMSWIRTKPGEPYDGELLQSDLQVVLSKRYFDTLQTRVRTEEGPRGGIDVIFEVAELPIISEVKIKGVTPGPELLVASKLALVGIDKDEPFESGRAKIGASVIKQFLESKGWRDVKVETSSENLNASTVKVTFSISGQKPE